MTPYENYNRYAMLFIIIFSLCNLDSSLCQAQSQSEITGIEPPSNQIPGSPEKVVNIDKELIPVKDSYSLGESPTVLVGIKFTKYRIFPWKLKGLHINEIVDENLEIDKASVGLVICSISDVNKYNIVHEDMGLNNLININDDKNKLDIVIPDEIDSDKRVFFWYNATIKKPGIFNTNTVVISDPQIGIFSDVDKSLRLQVDNFNPLSSYWGFLKDIIWILSLIVGLFTFYKQIIRGKDVKNIHIRDFLKEIVSEFRDLIQAIPGGLIIVVGLILLYLYSYPYFSTPFPKIYYPIAFMLKINLDKFSKIIPMIVIIIFTLGFLYVNQSRKLTIQQKLPIIGVYLSVHEWIREIFRVIFVYMPPSIAYTLFLLLFALPILLVLLFP